MGGTVGGECIAQPAGVRWGCVGGGGSAREGRVAVRGRAKVFGGEWVVRSAGLTHIRRSSSRARVLLYIRPPCLHREIAAMGPKDAPCEHASPAKTFAPAPSAFALPRPRSHFPRPRSHFPRIAFRGPRRAIGIPQQQLSTMGYPRKSYPHRCSPPCAKRSRPRACARVYIIYRSPVGRSRGVFAPLWGRGRAVVPPWPAPACAGWGRAKAKADAPRAATRTFPAYGRAPATYGRITVRKGGSAQGNPCPCPCVLPASACLRPRPCLPTAESLCAKAEVHQANPAPARAFSPRQLVYGRAPAC